MRQRTVGQRIALASGVVLSLTAVLGAISLISLGRVRHAMELLENDSLPGGYYAGRLDSSFKDMATAAQLHLGATSAEERQKREQELQRYAETQAVLLREVNHRVKNNLSAIIGVLHLEEGRVGAR